MASITKAKAPKVSASSRFTRPSVKGVHLKTSKAPRLGLTHVPKIKAAKKVSAKIASPLKMKSHL